MKMVIRTDDEQQVKRLLKADSMARFIWELKHNAWRKFKHTDIDYEPVWDTINEMLEEYHIDIEDLIE